MELVDFKDASVIILYVLKHSIIAPSVLEPYFHLSVCLSVCLVSVCLSGCHTFYLASDVHGLLCLV